jgi:energy-coupling factor transporter transmembrane protein EcfT
MGAACSKQPQKGSHTLLQWSLAIALLAISIVLLMQGNIFSFLCILAASVLSCPSYHRRAMLSVRRWFPAMGLLMLVGILLLPQTSQQVDSLLDYGSTPLAGSQSGTEPEEGVLLPDGSSSEANELPQEDNSTVVYVTSTGTKYHLDGCSSLQESKMEIVLSDAKKQGYSPCSRCHPPE